MDITSLHLMNQSIYQTLNYFLKIYHLPYPELLRDLMFHQHITFYHPPRIHHQWYLYELDWLYLCYCLLEVEHLLYTEQILKDPEDAVTYPPSVFVFLHVNLVHYFYHNLDVVMKVLYSQVGVFLYNLIWIFSIYHH